MSSKHPGRRLTKPPTVAEAIDELNEHTDKWIRRYEESWFDRDGIPAIEFGFNPPGDLDSIPALCDYAIEAVAHLAKLAKEAESKLAEVKKKLKRGSSRGRATGEKCQRINPCGRGLLLGFCHILNGRPLSTKTP